MFLIKWSITKSCQLFIFVLSEPEVKFVEKQKKIERVPQNSWTTLSHWTLPHTNASTQTQPLHSTDKQAAGTLAHLSFFVFGRPKYGPWLAFSPPPPPPSLNYSGGGGMSTQVLPVKDPSAGSRIETLSLLLPLDSQVCSTSQCSAKAREEPPQGWSKDLTKPPDQ